MLYKLPKTSKGFTLIELLIVIAVLGILAVAVLSAINPIEQINRSTDTGSRSDSEQLLSAIDRYYATQTLYPWMAVADDDPGVVWTKVDNSWKDAGGTNKVLDKLSESSANGTGELKAAFKNRITGTSYNFLQIYNAGATGDSTYVCFKPKSNAFKTEALTRCTDTSKPSDFPPSACGATSSDDYICLP